MTMAELERKSRMADIARQTLPDRVRHAIDSRKPTEKGRQSEIDAYHKIVAMIDDARDEFTKRVYSQTLEFVIHEGTMSLSYVLDQVMEMALKSQKKARKRLQPFALVEAIEQLLSGATYTENFGHSRRWPLYTRAPYSKITRVPRPVGCLEDAVLPENFLGAYYEFGVHKFYVGEVTEKIVRMIEKRKRPV